MRTQRLPLSLLFVLSSLMPSMVLRSSFDMLYSPISLFKFICPAAPAPQPPSYTPAASPAAEAADATASSTTASPPSRPPVPSKLPFQVQIRYTKPNGMKCMRVMTQVKPVTANRAEAEKVCADVCIVLARE